VTLREIKVDVTGDETVVDLWPGMFAKPSYEREPTKSNPSVKADLGMVGGKLSALKVYYDSDEFEVEDILDLTDSIDNDNSLFEKTKHCPMCERKRREIIERIREAIKRGNTDDERRSNMRDEALKIRSELRAEGYIEDDEDEEDYDEDEYYEDDDEDGEEVSTYPGVPVFEPTIPILPEFQTRRRYEAPQLHISEEVQEVMEPQQQEIVGNVNHALSDIHRTVLMLINTPGQIRLPFSDETDYQQR